MLALHENSGDAVETNLAVKDNDFEKIIKMLAEKQAQLSQKNQKSQLNLAQRRQLAMAIASVYYFLKVTLSLSEHWDLTLEEFETVEAELKIRAEKEERKFRRKFFKWLGLRSAWNYYLKLGHFPIKRAPVRGKRRWYMAHPWGSMNFDPDECHLASSAIPPNHNKLLLQIFEKRYPQVKIENKKTED